MSIKKSDIDFNVKVKFNKNWISKCLGDTYLEKEEYVLISDKHIYNDINGEYIRINSNNTSGTAYLYQLDLY